MHSKTFDMCAHQPSILKLLYKLKCGNIHKMKRVILTNDSSKLIFQDSIYDEATHIARQNSEIHK